MSEKQVTVRQISAAETRSLRGALLRQGVPIETLVYPGDNELDTLHVGAFIDGEQVGIATVMCQSPTLSKGTPAIHPDPDNPSAWRLRGMATTPEVRSSGIGTRMLKACIGHVADEGGAFLWCDARIKAVNFYRKNGFAAMGDEYYVPDVGPHYFMQRDVSAADVALLELYLDEGDAE